MSSRNNRAVGYLKKLGGLCKQLAAEQVNSIFSPCDFSDVIQQVDIKAGSGICGFLFQAPNAILFHNGKWTKNKRVIILSQDISTPFSQLCPQGNKTFLLCFFPVLLQRALPYNFSWLHLFLTMSLSNCAEIWKWLLNTHQRIKTKLNLNGLCYTPWKRDSWHSNRTRRRPVGLHKECHQAPLVASWPEWQAPTSQPISSNRFCIHRKRYLAWFPSNRLLNVATWRELILLVC